MNRIFLYLAMVITLSLTISAIAQTEKDEEERRQKSAPTTSMPNPPPDDAKTPNLPGAGCPVPPAGSTDVDYGPSPQDVICPPYDSDISKDNRSEAREVVRRYRALSPADQQALIEFLKEL